MKNIILITIDSLRFDHLSCAGYHRKLTPTICNLGKTGVFFSNAISCGPDTPASIVPLLTSEYVMKYYLNSGGIDRLKTSVEEFELMRNIILDIYKQKATMPEVLKSHGLNTAMFHSNPYLSRYYNFGKGFDCFYDSFSDMELKKYSLRRKIKGVLETNTTLFNIACYISDKLNRKNIDNVPYERAESINNKVISWLGKNKNNFFVWIHYMDVHFPYKPPKKFQVDPSISDSEISRLNSKMFAQPKDMTEGETSSLIDLYDGTIKYMDYSIQSLLNDLKKLDLLENTIIILTADHGDEFLDHNDFAHHNSKLYDELIRVPLIIYNSSYKNIEITEPVSLLSIAPTILSLLDLPPNSSFQGKSLIPIIEGEKKSPGVISESLQKGKRNISYRTKDWKFIINNVNGIFELYNLSDDPKEKKNLYDTEKEIAREFEYLINEHLNKELNNDMSNNKIRIQNTIRNLKVMRKI